MAAYVSHWALLQRLGEGALCSRYCHHDQAGGLSLGVLGSGVAGPGSLGWRAGEP